MIGLGILALILQLCIRRFMVFHYRLTDPSPLLTLQAFGLYFLLLDKVKIKKEKIQKVISNVAQYSFTFYLLHMFVLTHVCKRFPLNISPLHNALFGICIFIISFIITLGLSVIVEKILIKPIKKILEKKLIKTI